MHSKAGGERIKGEPIGIFDSGVGGLTVLKQLIERLPGEKMLYLGDTARLPYGTKSRETVIKYSLQNARFLVQKGIKCLVVACNTASSLALKQLEEAIPVPVVGVIQPGAERAARSTRKKKIGVIGTLATIRSGIYQQVLGNYARDTEVLAAPCPLFVPLVEEGWIQDAITIQVATRYLSPLRSAGVDVVVLGCTHYPLLKGVIHEVMGNDILLVDSAEEVARQVEILLDREELRNTSSEGPGSIQVFMSDCSEHFVEIGERFLGISLPPIELVDL